MTATASLPSPSLDVSSTDPSAAVGPRIRALRDAMGLSLRDLAERSGVSAPMLSQVERGETSPTLAVAVKIAAGLELTLSQLLRPDEGHVLVNGRNITTASAAEICGLGVARTFQISRLFAEMTVPAPRGPRATGTAAGRS